MRSRLVPVALLVCALAPARVASADDGAIIVRNPVAPIAGTPIWPKVEIEAPPRRAKSPALVILGIVVGALGVGGAVTGTVLLRTGTGTCNPQLDAGGNAIRQEMRRDLILDPVTKAPIVGADAATKGEKVTFVSSVSSCSTPDPRQNIGMTTLLASAGAVALGLTGILVGIQPAADEESSAARFVPTVTVGATGGTLTWRF